MVNHELNRILNIEPLQTIIKVQLKYQVHMKHLGAEVFIMSTSPDFVQTSGLFVSRLRSGTRRWSGQSLDWFHNWFMYFVQTLSRLKSVFHPVQIQSRYKSGQSLESFSWVFNGESRLSPENGHGHDKNFQSNSHHNARAYDMLHDKLPGMSIENIRTLLKQRIGSFWLFISFKSNP